MIKTQLNTLSNCNKWQKFQEMKNYLDLKRKFINHSSNNMMNRKMKFLRNLNFNKLLLILINVIKEDFNKKKIYP